jgi:choline dehydrogenase-like flavoprotein
MASHQDSATTADYVVIGGGTAGLVVANRLTEDPNIHVLVLEAGLNRSEDPRLNVPTFWTSLMGSEVD